MRQPIEFQRTLVTLLASIVCGALAGAIAGWTVSTWSFDLSTFLTGAVERPMTTTTTVSNPTFTVIPIDRRPQEPIVPPAFTDRRSSPVASAYRRVARKAGEEPLLTDDRLLGAAVAVTSDGWFVVPRAVMDGEKPADIILWHAGRSATATRAIADRLSGVVFLKTDLDNLPAPALARLHDVGVGLPVWVERRVSRFEPQIVVALSDPATDLNGASSEAVTRRTTVTGMTSAGDMGSPVWSTNGSLVGLVASPSGEPLRVIPVTAWAQSLQSVLSDGVVRHAYLGARTVDLTDVRFETQVPVGNRGAWLRDDARAKKPAVERNSPAAAAGLQVGDVIQTIDRDILDGSADLAELLAGYKPETKVTLSVLRGTVVIEIPVTLGSVVTSEEIK
ncbi:hypothetical protein A3E39_02025 [Candidatus Uhrbacteria bacterium RIFCSPHIGHO2_12_FULL_60_25]|uniref:PDZ domain-containing protein n=1 Tax=Candidatus Uhrbacteria bacterium RIFCSPHIGHO2_12_FULL_60_25 TaxID=1802399 RepID=A0A1F7UKY8_9BACT|nr:MAG: hypothetical protein A3D73_04285 [Candidatus Uhrbacteria bacterium RIFCSPHIGHO2_02_FULL_60_44]OGL78943.1 MAG: hypothetical protein A3E39_02025 [Candidatus Uhrbacteria bacterium RIFCSPHIGHO2_12_FULL_60_25]